MSKFKFLLDKEVDSGLVIKPKLVVVDDGDLILEMNGIMVCFISHESGCFTFFTERKELKELGFSVDGDGRVQVSHCK